MLPVGDVPLPAHASQWFGSAVALNPIIVGAQSVCTLSGDVPGADQLTPFAELAKLTRWLDPVQERISPVLLDDGLVERFGREMLLHPHRVCLSVASELVVRCITLTVRALSLPAQERYTSE